jgi:hypothetical protein
VPRNFLRDAPERRPTGSTGSAWTGTKGAKYDQDAGPDQDRKQQARESARLMRKSDGGLETEPKAPHPNAVQNDKPPYKGLRTGR